MSFTKPLVGSGRWAAPSIKASLNPGVGLQDMSNIVRNKPRDGDDPLTRKRPTAPGAPHPPIIEDVAGREQDTMDMLRRRRGRAASVLTDGNAGVPMTASKTLMGQ